MTQVSIVPCPSYDPALCREALIGLLASIGRLDFVKSGMTVGIKANLLPFMKPEAAVAKLLNK